MAKDFRLHILMPDAGGQLNAAVQTDIVSAMPTLVRSNMTGCLAERRHHELKQGLERGLYKFERKFVAPETLMMPDIGL